MLIALKVVFGSYLISIFLVDLTSTYSELLAVPPRVPPPNETELSKKSINDPLADSLKS